MLTSCCVSAYITVAPLFISMLTVAFWPVDVPFSSPLLYWWSYVHVSIALSPSFMMVLLTAASSTIFVVEASPPPPPLPAGMSADAISAPLLLVSARRTLLPSSLSSAFMPKTVLASISISFDATAAFCTGFVELTFRLSSTSVSLMVMATLPSKPGSSFLPFSVTLFTVPSPPKSSQLAACSQLSMFVPLNCLVSHLPCAVS